MEFHVRMFETFCEFERTNESVQPDRETNKTGESEDAMETCSSHIGEDESNDLLQSILQ